jgi:hypothetical protein
VVAPAVSRALRIACCVALFSPAWVNAQQESASVPVLSPGSIELSAFAGFSLGQSFTGFNSNIFNAGLTPQNVATRSSNGSVGGSVRVYASHRFLFGGEVSYIGGGHIAFNEDISQNLSPPITQASLLAHSSAILATGGVRYLIPISRRSHFIPYVSGGAGALIVRDHLTETILGNSQALLNASNLLFSGVENITHAAGYGDAGVSYYFSERAGIMFEGSGIRAGGLPFFGRVAIGMFVKLR